MQANDESSVQLQTYQRYPMLYKVLNCVRIVWNCPVATIKFNYLHTIPIIIVVGSTFNYIYLVTSYLDSITKVLELDLWKKAAFVFITTFFIGNMVGNSILNWSAFCNGLPKSPMETDEESKTVQSSKNAKKIRTEEPRKQMNVIQVLVACASSCHKRYSLMNLCHVIMLCVFLSFCTYQYLKQKVKGFSIVNEHLRYIFANHNFYESFVDHPEWPQQKFLPLLTFVVVFLFAATVILFKRVFEIIAKNSVRWHPKDCVEFLFGTRWYLAMIWPFVESPEPQNIHVKSS